MTPRAVEPDSESELPELEPKELEGVDSIFTWIDKTSRVFQIYPENNKIYIDFTEGLAQAFVEFLTAFKELELEVGEAEFRYKARTVYEEPNRSKSLAMRLFRDGVRKVVFYEGIEKREILDFLDVLTHPAGTDDIEDDLVTLLWSKDFDHLSYFVLDDLFVSGAPEGLDLAVKTSGEQDVLSAPSQTAPEPSDDIRSLIETPTRAAEPLSAVLTIEDHDRRVVEEMIARERARDLRHDLTTLLFELVGSRDDEETFKDAIAVLGQLVRSHIAARNLAEAVEVVRKFRELAESELPDEYHEIVAGEIERAGGPEALKEIGRLFEQPIMQNTKEVHALLVLLGKPVLPHLISFIPGARSRQVLTSVITDLVRECPEDLVRWLGERDPVIVKHLIGILGGLGDARLAAHIVPHLEHPVVAVRLEAVRALNQLGGVAAREGLERGLLDPEYQVRIQALRCIEESRQTSAVHKLELVVEDRDFPNRNLYEKQEFFRTIAVLGGEHSIPFLSKVLERGAWLRRSKTDESRNCAASALGYIPSQRTVRILERQAKSANRGLREACLEALEKVRAEIGEVA